LAVYIIVFGILRSDKIENKFSSTYSEIVTGRLAIIENNKRITI